MVGLTGATVSMVTLSVPEAALVLPATSVAVAVRLCPPLLRAAVVKLQAPAPLAVMLPSRLAPSKTFTVELASYGPVGVPFRRPPSRAAVAVRLCPPLLRAAVVKLQAPAPLAVMLPSRLAPSKT